MAAAFGARMPPSNVEQQDILENAGASVWNYLQRGEPEIVLRINSLGNQGAAVADRYNSLICMRVYMHLDARSQTVRISSPRQLQVRKSSIEPSSLATPGTQLSSFQTSSPKSSTGASPDVHLPLYQARASANSRSKLAKDCLTKIPRPANAFILYRKHHHPIVRTRNPGIHNNQISIIIGELWKKEAEDIKQTYKTQAEELKRKHVVAYPEYQYQPRKPSEKKRRMTKRKAALLATSPSDVAPSTHLSDLAELDDDQNDELPSHLLKATYSNLETSFGHAQPTTSSIDPSLTYSLPTPIPTLFSALNAPLPSHFPPTHVQSQALHSGLGNNNADQETANQRSATDFSVLDAYSQALHDRLTAELAAEDAKNHNLDFTFPNPEDEARYNKRWRQWDVNESNRMESLKMDFGYLTDNIWVQFKVAESSPLPPYETSAGDNLSDLRPQQWRL